MAIYKNENGTMVKYAGRGGSTGSSGASVVISSTEPTDQNVGDLWLVIDGDDGTVDDETGGLMKKQVYMTMTVSCLCRGMIWLLV